MCKFADRFDKEEADLANDFERIVAFDSIATLNRVPGI
jgi:hypothetical protein